MCAHARSRTIASKGRWLFALIISWPLALAAQSGPSAPFQIFAGYTYLSNSFNGVPGEHQPLNGWDTSVAFPSWHNLRFKIDASGYRGENLGAPQRAFFILGGGQYERTWHRERFYVQALLGEGGFNRKWAANGALGGTASIASLLGGGVDTPLNHHFAIRFEGDFQYSNLALIQSLSDPVPYRIPGLPKHFGRISTGLVWIPRSGAVSTFSGHKSYLPRQHVESEVIFESLNSFGHYHIFAFSWWSYLNVAGLEYDRHSWGKFAGARMDYVATILPLALLKEPSKTDVFGDPLTKDHKTLAGLGISPIGLRMMWRDGKNWKPYYIIKGGMIGFAHKALSDYASYEDFTLEQDFGFQFRLNDRWDLRTGVSDFHFSNGFMVPNNPGIDEMMYSAGLSYHVKK